MDRARVAHHLIDIVDPDQAFTAGDYCREAQSAADIIHKRGKTPLFVGGTGLYLDSFFKGLSRIPAIDKGVKASLKKELAERGLAPLYEELMGCDPEFGKRIHPNDRQRILRGLEVYRGSGKPLSAYFTEKSARESSQTLYLGIEIERKELVERIERRVDMMMSSGFLEEVRRLRGMGFGPELNSMRSIGYAQLHEHLEGRLPLAGAVESIKTETKRYAKRQMTWFRKNKAIQWFRYFEVEKIKKVLYIWLHQTKENFTGLAES